jgi:hypothetical protein
MSKFAVSAAGGAMPAGGQPNHADPDSSRELLRIADDLNDMFVISSTRRGWPPAA